MRPRARVAHDSGLASAHLASEGENNGALSVRWWRRSHLNGDGCIPSWVRGEPLESVVNPVCGTCALRESAGGVYDEQEGVGLNNHFSYSLA